MPNIIICDIDGTLLNGSDLINKTWDYVQSLDGALYLVTARPESQRDETVADLSAAGVTYSRLIMKPLASDDSVDYKRATAQELLATKDVIVAVENDQATREAYASLGIKVVNPSDIEPEERAINQEAPEYMRDAAARGLEYYSEGLGGDGLVDRTIREARLMVEGTVSDDKWIRIAAWIARHLDDLDAPDANPDSEGYPSAGVVAHLLWGSGPSKAAAQRALDYAESVVARIRKEQDMETNATRAALNELAVGDWVSWNVLDPEIAATVVEVSDDQAVLALYEFEDGIFQPTEYVMPLNIFKLERIPKPEMVAEKLPEMQDHPEEQPTDEPADPTSDIKAKAEQIIAKIDAMNESEPMTEPVIANRDKWLSAAWKIKARLEGSEGRSLDGKEIRSAHVELRAEGDGRSFTGYAALFNQPSLPLPFTEIVKPGAFKRSLQSRNRMMLLWNHDTSNPLASTRNGSLQLTEDERGLKVTATLPQTSLGNDIAVLVRDGVIDAMSFGFSVRKDSWSQDGQTRYLEDVSLYEVSLVSTPAYEQTSGTVSVRSTDGISADALADALLKIESGEELDAEQGALMQDVISRLSAGKIEETDGDVMALYKKKLALAEMGN